jgi:F-type H+-transporting ATPase subunit b
MRFASHLRLLALAVFCALVFAAPALAADAHGHGEKSGGLDFTGIKRYDLGIYTLIVFGILMFVLSKFAWPHIKAGLEKREANILTALEQAKQDAAAARTELDAARRELAKAAEDARAILDEARRDAEALKVSEREVGAQEAQAERERGKRDAALALEAMRKEYQQEVVELALLIASKALRQQVSLDNQHKLLDESIAELKANATQA